MLPRIYVRAAPALACVARAPAGAWIAAPPGQLRPPDSTVPRIATPPGNAYPKSIQVMGRVVEGEGFRGFGENVLGGVDCKQGVGSRQSQCCFSGYIF